MTSSSSSSLTCSKLTSWILFAIFLQVLGLSFFVIGFFPVKPTLHGKSGLESYQMPTCESVVDDEESDLGPEQLRSLYKEMSEIPPTFDRLILMVVDGLPAEFVLGRGEQRRSKSMMEAMPYTQSLLSDGRAIGYHAKAAPPTVTMPRLKAMVSGAIGGFLDVAFNFNTQAFLDDNLLDQFYRIGWKMVMLGDETWIKLFPGLFTRQDGVSSFYVKDTVEVDFNVSRHLEVELTSTDWNLLILHYLGLDHVGHIGGRWSILMAPKLKEMDEVIKMIHMHKILHQDNLDMRTLLVVVSDHGMTDGGNHGGSSYEETDSLALFIGGDAMKSDYASSGHNTAFQVDIAPTLAILLGVPIPKNNIGVLLVEVLNSLTEKQRLHALELNSWQLLRLLHAHLPGILCGNLSYYINEEHDSKISGTVSNTQERLYHLFSKASAAHNTREMRQQGSDFKNNNTDDLNAVVSSYYDFLRNASEWLSHRATDKPFKLLLSGVAILVLSCILFLILLYCLFEEALPRQKQSLLQLKEFSYSWHLDEAFVCLGILIHVISLGSSSMVEEEQYTWHFLASTLYLIFLFKTVESFLKPNRSGSIEVIEGRERNIFHHLGGTVACSSDKVTGHGLSLLKHMKDYYQIISVLVVLVCGRLLRGWHQGGVNWVDLPDISKWLEQAGVSKIRSLQIISLPFLLLLNSFSIGLIRSRIILADLSIVSHLASGLLVCLHIIESWGLFVLPNSLNSTSVAQIFYLTVSVTVVVTVLSSPWILYLCDYRTNLMTKLNRDCLIDNLIKFPLLGVRDSMYLIGMTLSASWCLLQILLQQPINSVPTLLIFIQLFASIIYFSADGSFHKQWVEVVAIYFLGMSGHFGLGNSNSLATVDVAGAFIGISRHSTVLSGILMFVITYASPLLSFLSLFIYLSLKDLRELSSTKDSELGCMLRRMIAFPCILPLVLNSIVLTVFTIVLLLMRDHLFVWSVFSPKYLYVCGMTVSVYIGVSVIAATGLYVCIVITFRRKRLCSNVDTRSR